MIYFFKPDSSTVQEIPYSTFTTYLDRNEVDAVKILNGNEIDGTLKSSGGDLVRFKTLIPYQDSQLIPTLKDKGVKVSGGVSGPSPARMLIEFLPWIIGFVFIWFMFRSPGRGK